MRRLSLRPIVLLLLTSCLALPRTAQAFIVYDPANHAELATQLSQLVKQYQQQLQQLQQAIQQTNAITGTRSMGSLLNSPAAAELRRYLPSDWQSTMSMAGATGLSASAQQTQSLYNGYYATYAPVTGAAAIPGDPTGPIAQSIDRETETTYAAMAAGSSSYNTVTPRISTYEGLLQQLNQTTDLKSSIDLQSRISAENGLTLNELVRLEAIRIEQKAAEDNQKLAETRQSAAANQFNTANAQNAWTAQQGTAP